jgi:hypothetical protein
MSSAIQVASDTPKSELVQQLVRARATLRSAREATKQAGKIAVAQVLAAAGGATAGAFAVKLPLIPKTQVPTDLAVGSALALGCALDMFDSANDYVSAFAMGMLGAGAARETQKILSKR